LPQSAIKEALALHQAGQWQQAEKIYRQLLAEDEASPDPLHLLGLIEAERGQIDLGINMIERAIGLNPKMAAYHHNLAGLYRRVGRFDAAIARFESAISLNPIYGEAYQGLAEMKHFDAGDPLGQQLTSLLQRTDVPDRERSYLQFAAGKFFDDVGEPATAFGHFKQANRLAGRPFSIQDQRAFFKDVIYHARDLPSDQGGMESSNEVTPIFVVGMPRSGTTLVEQILASHSGVVGAGELSDIAQLLRPIIHSLASGRMTQTQLQVSLGHVRQRYLDVVSKFAEADVRYVVDKHPLNFQYLGYMHWLWPQAPIIHVVRDPLDTCVSCFFQNFTHGQNYSFDLTHLGLFYQEYRRLMRHWSEDLKGAVTEVHYERLVEDPESSIRRLLERCDLSFETACLSFHSTERVVETASFRQVRQPLYRHAIGRYKAYAAYLLPLARALGLEDRLPIVVSEGSRLSE